MHARCSQDCVQNACKLAHTLLHPFQEKMSMVKASEAKLEEDKRRLKEGLEAAESRGARLEQQRQALEDELQRARLALGEQQAEARVLQDRAELLQRQVRPACNPHTH